MHCRSLFLVAKDSSTQHVVCCHNIRIHAAPDRFIVRWTLHSPLKTVQKEGPVIQCHHGDHKNYSLGCLKGMMTLLQVHRSVRRSEDNACRGTIIVSYFVLCSFLDEKQHQSLNLKLEESVGVKCYLQNANNLSIYMLGDAPFTCILKRNVPGTYHENDPSTSSYCLR